MSGSYSVFRRARRLWPFVRRGDYDRLVDKCDRQVQTLRDRDRSLSRLGHRVDETKREHAKLLTDLRIVRAQIEYPSPHSDKVGFAFQMHGALFDGFRHDRTFVELLAYMVEEQMHRTPEGRSFLAGVYSGRPL